jgi:hypothetical protein
MDLIELQRSERRKVWIFCWLFFGFCLLTAVEFSDYSTEPEVDAISACIEVLGEHDSVDEDSEQVEACRMMLLDILKQSKTKVTV